MSNLSKLISQNEEANCSEPWDPAWNLGGPSSPIPPTPEAVPDDIDGVSALHWFANKLGHNTVFVPQAPGTKKSPIKWGKRPDSDTYTDAYRNLFGMHNISVRLGDGIASIDMDKQSDVDAFLQCNPQFGKTFCTAGARGCNLWFRLIGDFPGFVHTPNYEWRVDRKHLTTVWGKHPSGCNYKVLCSNAPISIRFSDIIWPNGWEVPGEREAADKALEETGQPLVRIGKTVKLNPAGISMIYYLNYDVTYEQDSGLFWKYNERNGLWESRTCLDMAGSIGRVVRQIIGQEILAQPANKDMLQSLLCSIDAAMTSKCVQGLKEIAVRNHVDFNRRFGITHLKNGVLDMTEANGALQLLDFNKRFGSRNQIPYSYVPGSGCHRFLTELIGPHLNADDAYLLQEWMGLAVLGVNYPQIVLIVTGKGSTGKSTISEVIRGIIGEKNAAQLRMKHIDGRFETSHFIGKTLLYGLDVPSDFLNSESSVMLKSITGDSGLMSEIKGKGTITISGRMNLLITANTKLHVRLEGDASAWERRLVLLGFDGPPPKTKIPNFSQVLLDEEGDGITTWALEGAQRVFNRGKVRLTQDQIKRTRELIQESDSPRRFFQDCVKTMNISGISMDDENMTMTSDELEAAYNRFCIRNGWMPQRKRGFLELAKDLMLEMHGKAQSTNIERDNRRHRGYVGVYVSDGLNNET